MAVSGAGWLFVAAVAVVLGITRFNAASGSPDRMDFDTIFLPAAQAVASGASPYMIRGYVYSPIYALALAPISHQAWADDAVTVVLLACGIAACLVLATSFTAGTPSPLASPAVAGGAIVTLLYSWPATYSLWGVHPEMLVLFCLAVAAASRGVTSGFALASAAAVKTWPAVLGLWLLRSRLRPRIREWVGVGAAAMGTIAVCLLVDGPMAIVDMFMSAYNMRSQPLVAYSTSGAARLLFTRGPNSDPVLDSPLGYTVSFIVLTLWVLVLLVVVLRRPGETRLALFNLAFVVVLLLPVSHLGYLMLPLPALWFWVARALQDQRSSWSWGAAAALCGWWLLAMRIPPAGDPFRGTTWQSFLLIFGTTLIAATVSVLAASRLGAPAANAPATRAGL